MQRRASRGFPLWQGEKEEFGYPAGLPLIRPGPVSYTHLDVYKRQRQSSAEWIARVYRWYEGIRHLQTLTMERHEILPDGVRRVTYENGDQIVVDYRQKKAYLNGKQILPLE